MSTVKAQYEVYPYPARDPADEAKRLITGSPSVLMEMDHYLWDGARDWAAGTRVLVAGGGTGDGLIQLAVMLRAAKVQHDITYIDLSEASRAVAEARAAERGLEGITFLTGSLLDAPDLGSFDYIDCRGVLHHLPDPSAGFAALSGALAPGGGLGFMVYAPYGRAGVYPLQAAFETLYGHLPPAEKLAAAKAVFETLPDGHMFARNTHVVDHTSGDAGFYDLLLHSTDRPYAVSELLDELKGAGLGLVDLLAPSAYDPALYAVVDHGLDWMTAMSVAEQLSGSMKVHVGYAVPDARGAVSRAVARPDQVPHLDGTRNDPKLANKLAQVIANSGSVPIVQGEVTLKLAVPKGIARAVAGINGRRSLAELQAGSGLEQGSFDTAWAALDDALCGWNKMWYSRLLRR